MSSSLLSPLLILGEYLLFLGCFALAVLLRVQGWDDELTPLLFWARASAASLVLQFCFYGNDLYSTREVSSRLVLFRRYLGGMAFALVILAVLYYSLPQLAIGRGYFAISMSLFSGAFFAERLIVRRVLGARWLGKRYLVMGTGEFARELGRLIESREKLGYRLLGFLDLDQERASESADLPILGTYEDVVEVSREHQADEVIVALANRRGTMPVQELLELKFKGVTITEGVTFYEREYNRVYVRQLNPSWIIFNQGFRVSPLAQAAKRSLDIVCALTGFLLAWPLLLGAAIAVKLTSRGPVFYTQERAGIRGKPFTMWKFRSMAVDAEAGKPQFAQKNDPRVTTVGRFMRKTRVDELPQLFNVLKGDMSLVGPRPERPFFIEKLKEKIPFYDQRLQVKPGLTGLAQISHGYTTDEEDHLQKLQYDLCYIKNLSVALDITIMAKTVKVVLTGSGAQ